MRCPAQFAALFTKDPPLFASEVSPACGPSIRQSIGPIIKLINKYLGDQWSIGDWTGTLEAAKTELPDRFSPIIPYIFGSDGQIPQHMKEYDPEWGRAAWEGSLFASCDHARMLASVKCPVLYMHHFRQVDETDGHLMGAASDLQAKRVCELVSLRNSIDYRSFPQMSHNMHAEAPQQFAELLVEFSTKLAAH